MKLNNIIFIIIFITTLWIFVDILYLSKTQSFVGCAIDLCDKTIQDWHYRNGGQKYYARYEQNSKEYWSAYCSQMASLPEELEHYKCK